MPWQPFKSRPWQPFNSMWAHTAEFTASATGYSRSARVSQPRCCCLGLSCLLCHTHTPLLPGPPSVPHSLPRFLSFPVFPMRRRGAVFKVVRFNIQTNRAASRPRLQPLSVQPAPAPTPARSARAPPPGKQPEARWPEAATVRRRNGRSARG
jgi:hypothetical protein